MEKVVQMSEEEYETINNLLDKSMKEVEQLRECFEFEKKFIDVPDPRVRVISKDYLIIDKEKIKKFYGVDGVCLKEK